MDGTLRRRNVSNNLKVEKKDLDRQDLQSGLREGGFVGQGGQTCTKIHSFLKRKAGSLPEKARDGATQSFLRLINQPSKEKSYEITENSWLALNQERRQSLVDPVEGKADAEGWLISGLAWKPAVLRSNSS